MNGRCGSIKKAFDANGIKFAFPTVQIASDGEPSAAATAAVAQRTLELVLAIGFGAQTFVRDVIAGMFYLLDDAFRIGEYIQSGNYKGTVEGFSIRSVRLRHQRGAVQH